MGVDFHHLDPAVPTARGRQTLAATRRCCWIVSDSAQSPNLTVPRSSTMCTLLATSREALHKSHNPPLRINWRQLLRQFSKLGEFFREMRLQLRSGCLDLEK